MKLLFIYNANSGKLNALFDAGHKLFSPSTYKCSLCALTYDTFTENTVWKTYRKESNIDMVFYHKDEFENVFPKETFQYPVILQEKNNHFLEFISNKSIRSIEEIEDLIKLIRSKVSTNHK